MTVQTLEKEFKTTPHAVETSEARWLHTHLPPLPIENEKDHVLYRRVVDVLMEEGKTGGDFHAYLDAVIHFLDEYEKAQFPTRATPEDVLRFLMEQHDLAQKDLARELGGQSVVSEILSGDRKSVV